MESVVSYLHGLHQHHFLSKTIQPQFSLLLQHNTEEFTHYCLRYYNLHLFRVIIWQPPHVLLLLHKTLMSVRMYQYAVHLIHVKVAILLKISYHLYNNKKEQIMRENPMLLDQLLILLAIKLLCRHLLHL